MGDQWLDRLVFLLIGSLLTFLTQWVMAKVNDRSTVDKEVRAARGEAFAECQKWIDRVEAAIYKYERSTFVPLELRSDEEIMAESDQQGASAVQTLWEEDQQVESLCRRLERVGSPGTAHELRLLSAGMVEYFARAFDYYNEHGIVKRDHFEKWRSGFKEEAASISVSMGRQTWGVSQGPGKVGS